ncbi:hypothetical protein [Candidatus Ichthyocystis hellenicum]|uniref:hypothetical protein n=1 Tax=Candidatus Ichthyocystis hellenicum TaxID=1561003 RepID=UPI000B81730A|nr:hypothetical protein [Candidatus Ichthyocystis hellenicum]
MIKVNSSSDLTGSDWECSSSHSELDSEGSDWDMVSLPEEINAGEVSSETDGTSADKNNHAQMVASLQQEAPEAEGHQAQTAGWGDFLSPAELLTEVVTPGTIVTASYLAFTLFFACESSDYTLLLPFVVYMGLQSFFSGN